MPFENKELSRAWKIVFVDCIERGEPWGVMTRFEVTSPDGKTRSIRPVFSMEFVDDYFHIPGDQNMSHNRKRILQEKEELFKRWGLVRIEELLSKDSLEREPKITCKDFKWAEKIEKGHLQLSSQQEGINVYVYILERRIGFK
ncbi:MAG: hypothetical protein J7J51_02250 [Candidatus Omnitrophica bacterium]|nr:hypothetical protein [Candidatus Omnitrophota bacterium]